MEHSREDMQSALKRTVIPYLRSVGFKGSLPHLYRTKGARIDLLTVQYHSAGSCLLIEVAPSVGEEAINPKLLRVHSQGMNRRLRLYRGESTNNHWFCYAASGFGSFLSVQAPDEIAHQLCKLLATQAEEWWATAP